MVKKQKKLTSHQRKKDFDKIINYIAGYTNYLRLADSHLELYHIWGVWKYNFLFCIEYIKLSRKYRILRNRKYSKFSFTIWLKYIPILIIFNIVGIIVIQNIMNFSEDESERLGLFCLPQILISLTIFHFVANRKLRNYYEYLLWIWDIFPFYLKD